MVGAADRRRPVGRGGCRRGRTAAPLADRGLGTGTCVAAFAGIYACVPETERIASAAVIVAIPFVAEVTGQLPGRWPTTVTTAAVALWAAYYGGVFRDSALVGGFASLGLVVLEPIAVRLPGPRRGVPEPLTVAALLVLQTDYAVGVARTAGLRPDLWSAIAIAIPMAVVLRPSWLGLVIGRHR